MCREIYTDEQAVKAFTLPGINSAPARLDFDKMDHINGEHVKTAHNDLLLSGLIPFLETGLSGVQKNRLSRAMDNLKSRSKNFKDMARQSAYLLLERPLEITGKAAKPLRREDAKYHLSALTEKFEALNKWNSLTIHKVLADYAAANEVGFGKFGQPLRAALTAGNPSPDLSDVLAFLGREETIGRLKDALETSYNAA